MLRVFLSNILARQQWLQLLSGLHYAAQGRQEEDAVKSAKKDKDPVNKSGDKAKKKKQSKGKVRDKLNNLVLFDKATYDKLCNPTISL